MEEAGGGLYKEGRRELGSLRSQKRRKVALFD